MQNMAVCSFLSHRDIYDVDIYSALQKAVKHVVETNDFVDFWISSAYDKKFMLYCLLAALGERNKHPKKVIITFVVSAGELYRIPSCMYDREISPQKSEIVSHKDMVKWIIKKSTHLIKCVYENLHDSDMKFPKSIYSRLSEIIDIANPETKQAIIESVQLMTEKEQVVFNYINEGYKQTELSGLLEISQERVRQLLQQGCRKLRENMRQQYTLLKGAGQYRQEHSCCILNLGDPTPKALYYFRQTVSFLVSSFGIQEFYMEQPDKQVEFFRELSIHMPNIRIIAVVDGNDDDDNVRDQLYTLCSAVQCISDIRPAGRMSLSSVVTYMADKADFCICNLPEVANVENLQVHLLRTHPVMLLNLAPR